MSKTPRYLETPPDWTPEEQPTLPGSPAAIAHSVPKRFIYFFIGLFIALSASLSNGFITANLPLIQGEYGLTPSEAAWLPAAYVPATVWPESIFGNRTRDFYCSSGITYFCAYL